MCINENFNVGVTAAYQKNVTQEFIQFPLVIVILL